MKDIPVITIDGPSGSGKGAVGQLLAARLGWHFLDSGAIYRALALLIIKRNIPHDAISAIVDIGKNLDIKFIIQPGSSQKILLGNEEITVAIRHEECGNLASKIAVVPEVRAILVDQQRSFCRSPGLVADGRDMGTVVFPRAKLKFFLTASTDERARRRLLQLQDQGINATLDEILCDLEVRDKRDCARRVSPLKPDIAAIIIDTTKLSVDEVLQQILAHVKNMHF